MNGLRLSKVPSTPCASRPPFGASRVGVAQTVKPGRQRRLAVHGDGVGRAPARAAPATSTAAIRRCHRHHGRIANGQRPDATE